jgi:hypothetical protein
VSLWSNCRIFQTRLCDDTAREPSRHVCIEMMERPVFLGDAGRQPGVGERSIPALLVNAGKSEKTAHAISIFDEIEEYRWRRKSVSCMPA